MMKIAFPVQEDHGFDSKVYNHFGSAGIFIIINSETGEKKLVNNADLNHIHGQCQPLAALNGAVVDGIVVGGVGRGALSKLRNAGIKVFRAVEGTVAENLKLFKDGQLPEFEMNHICAGHGKGGVCAH
jgi:predicted Fe-Mo cluster-binding NifX family protein